MCVVRTLSWTVQVSPATKHKIVLNSTRRPVQISPATTPQQQQYPATWPSDHICADSWYPATYKGRSSNYWVLNPAPYHINKSLRGRKGSMRRCSTWFFSLTAWRIGEIWHGSSSYYHHTINIYQLNGLCTTFGYAAGTTTTSAEDPAAIRVAKQMLTSPQVPSIASFSYHLYPPTIRQASTSWPQSRFMRQVSAPPHYWGRLTRPGWSRKFWI